MGVLKGLGVRDGVACVAGLVVAGGGDEQETVRGVGGIGLEPALRDIAGALMRGVAGALVGGEAGGDGGVAVEDAEVDFGFGEVSVEAVGGGVEDGGVTLWGQERAVGAQEGGGSCGGVAEGGWVEKGGDATPLVIYRHEDGAENVLVEFDGEDGVEFVGVAERQEVEMDGVGEWDVAVVEVLRGSSNGRQRGEARAIVRGL